jgi:hypothetical protein
LKGKNILVVSLNLDEETQQYLSFSAAYLSVKAGPPAVSKSAAVRMLAKTEYNRLMKLVEKDQVLRERLAKGNRITRPGRPKTEDTPLALWLLEKHR